MRKSQLLKKWDAFGRNLKRSNPTPTDQTVEEKLAMLKRMEDAPILFMQTLFPAWCQAPFSKWQKRYIKKVVKNPRIFLTRAIHREGAKTTLTQMLLMYLALHEHVRFALWVSKSFDNAAEMLEPIRQHLQRNPVLIHYYGEQHAIGSWEGGEFTTRGGVKFKALGKGQSPRGSKSEETRPDMIICDDIDEDEEVLNAARLDKSWDWLIGALYGAGSIVGSFRFVVLNNLISEDSLMQRAISQSDDHETVNLLGKDGKPTWPERYTLQSCQYMIQKMGSILAEREYFNNPQKPGKYFRKEWMVYAKRAPISQYSHVIAYLDPSFSSRQTADHKALVCVGMKGDEYHILKAYCDITTPHEMIGWHYDLEQWLKSNNGTAEYWMEEVFLQQLLYKEFDAVAKERGHAIPVRGDKRQKPNKDQRIMGITGYFERGKVKINAAERNHHMDKLEDQLLCFQPGKTGVAKDGPDALEGAIYLLNERVITEQPPIIAARGSANKYGL